MKLNKGQFYKLLKEEKEASNQSFNLDDETPEIRILRTKIDTALSLILLIMLIIIMHITNVKDNSNLEDITIENNIEAELKNLENYNSFEKYLPEITVTKEGKIIKQTKDEIPLSNIVYNHTEHEDKLNNYIAMLPDKMITGIYSKNWNFIITDEDLSLKFFNGAYTKVHAVTGFEEKTVYISSTSDYLDRSALHEIGHIIDFENGWVHKTNEFYRIYTDERLTYKAAIGKNATNYAKTSSTEYFAEAFQDYFLNPEQLMQTAPRTYGYVSAIVDKYR